MPVYGLAENAVGLVFPPPGRGPRIDRVAARALPERGPGASARRRTTTGALRFVSVGSELPEHEVRIVDEAGDDVPERTVGRLVFRGPSQTRGLLREAGGHRRHHPARRMARQRRPRLPRGRRDLHRGAAEGPDHQGRPQPRPPGDRGGGRGRATGSAGAAWWPSASTGPTTGRRAWWWWRRRARRTRPSATGSSRR